MSLLEQYGSDAVRYWAVSARPGVDTAFDEGQMKIGRRLSIKLLNASKFVLGVMGDDDIPTADAIRVPLDQSLLEHLRRPDRRRDARVRRLRLRRARSSSPSGSSGASATTTSSW